MLPQWIIERKRDGHALTAEEIEFLISGYTRGDIPDYQMAAFAMAVYFRGMTADETAALTLSMLRSGDVLDTSALPGPKVDKHSTGGVGDKLSLIVAPWVACCGVFVPMISGRGLGLTGGTLDKLEAIPGYRTALTIAEFLGVLRRCGCSIIGQTERLAPADRKLYALRDVTGTVPSIPLIVASIMSKKLAEGLDGLVLDVKCGAGAFMHTLADAQALAAALVRVGQSMGKQTRALITAMDQPLGRTAGNALEVAEAVATLHGRGPADVLEVSLALAGEMLVLAGVAHGETEASNLLRKQLTTGAALERFRQMVELHGGDAAVVDDPGRLPTARHQRPIPAPGDGFVHEVNAEMIGRVCLLLGAGRSKTTDAVDPAVGVSGLVKVGERVSSGAPLMVLHANDATRLAAAAELAVRAVALGATPVPPAPRLLGRERPREPET